MIFQTVFEFLLIALVIVCIVYEPVLVAWEEKQKERVLKAFKKQKEYRK